MTGSRNTRIKKLALLKAYLETFGNVSESCKIVGICRTTYYDYINNDKDFEQKLENILSTVEIPTVKLIKRINKNALANGFVEISKGNVEDKNIKHLYIVHCKGSTYYKVGQATNLKSRLSHMQTGCPYELSVIWASRVIDGPAIEKTVHNALSGLHVRGEWYDLNSSQLGRLINILKESLKQNKLIGGKQRDLSCLNNA